MSTTEISNCESGANFRPIPVAKNVVVGEMKRASETFHFRGGANFCPTPV